MVIDSITKRFYEAHPCWVDREYPQRIDVEDNTAVIRQASLGHGFG
jgi:hypothetical protein